MEGQNDMSNDEREIRTESVSIGKPQRIDPNVARAEIFVSPQALDRRQDAFGQRRRYVGEQSEDEPKSRIKTHAERYDKLFMPPTSCAEPPGEELTE